MIAVDLDALQALLVRVFLVATMLAIGLHVTVPQITDRLRQPVLVAVSLALNFVALPLIVWLLTSLADLSDGVTAGLIVTAVAAGGPLGPKLVELSGGDVAFGVGLMFLMDVVAIVAVAPIASLLLANGTGSIDVDAGTVFVSMVAFQAIPLTAGLAVSRLRPEAASGASRPMRLASTGLLIALSIVVVLNSTDDLVRLGLLPVAVMVVSILAALALGALAAAGDPGLRRSLALTTAQRNTALALLVVTEMAAPGAVGVVVAFALCQLVVNGAVAVSLGRARPLAAVVHPG